MAFTINDIDLDEFNANTVKNPSVNEYFYAIKDVREAPKTTMKRVVGGGYTNKGVGFGDSGDIWHIIKTSVALGFIWSKQNDQDTPPDIYHTRR